MTVLEHSDDIRRAKGLQIREATLTAMMGEPVALAVKSLDPIHMAVILDSLLAPEFISLIWTDLATDAGWSRERWLLTSTDEVVPVTDEDFERAPKHLRFSDNECLRKPAADAFSLRGFLSGITAESTATALSGAAGLPVKLASVEMARYRQGDYLMRHSDTFENRCFGFVWFFSEGWQDGYGAELALELPTGECVSVQPLAGRAVALAIRSGCFHQVNPNTRADWTRYSIATHFRLATPQVEPRR